MGQRKGCILPLPDHYTILFDSHPPIVGDAEMPKIEFAGYNGVRRRDFIEDARNICYEAPQSESIDNERENGNNDTLSLATDGVAGHCVAKFEQWLRQSGRVVESGVKTSDERGRECLAGDVAQGKSVDRVLRWCAGQVGDAQSNNASLQSFDISRKQIFVNSCA